MSKAKPDIILLDDHPLILRSMRAIVEMDGDFTILATVSSADELFEKLKVLKPTIVVLDISLPDVDGFDIFAKLRAAYPNIKTIIYTMHRVRRYMEHFYKSGANGYVLKSGELGELVDALKAVRDGERYFPEEVTGINRMDQAHDQHEIQLTHTELFILRALFNNESNKEIADKMELNVHEVIDIRKSLLFKTGSVSTNELLDFAKKRKWIF